MVTLSISSQKGGVGKTTTAINLAYAFAQAGRRTLLVDADPQGSVGLSLTRQSRSLLGFYDALENAELDLDELVVATRLSTLSLVPAGQASEYELDDGTMQISSDSVQAFFDKAEEAGYEVVIMDTAAGLFGVTADVLSLTDAVIVPQQAEPLGVRSLPKMLKALTRLRSRNPAFRILGVLLTMEIQDLAESREASRALRDILQGGLVFESSIPRDDIFVKASARGVPAGVMNQGANIGEIYDQLRLEIESRIKSYGIGEI